MNRGVGARGGVFGRKEVGPAWTGSMKANLGQAHLDILHDSCVFLARKASAEVRQSGSPGGFFWIMEGEKKKKDAMKNDGAIL